MPKKIAVVLFNLGGPDSLDAVQPFLFNLFCDKAIITVPNPFRYFIAKLISSKRTHQAKEIYSQIGGRSPILFETEAQKKALEKKLNGNKNEYKVFISMRYWYPFSYETIEDVKKYSPDEIILLPLYPQFSTTTTESSVDDWGAQAKKIGMNIKTNIVKNYFFEENFIKSHSSLIKKLYKNSEKLRILFSAHGLPKKIVEKGDPYQRQVEKTVELVVKDLAIENLDYVVCYQSRVGPLEWIGPSTESELERAGEEKVSVMVVPIAFVSEHSETLVELDIEYKKLAMDSGVKNYYRVPTLSTDELFIKSLAEICLNSDKFSEIQF